MKEETEKKIIEILAKLHTMPDPESPTIEYEEGYYEALRDARHIIKDYLLKL
jgi:hypothetical protein